MDCPACNHQLTEVQVGAVAVDVCQGGCGGVWFDAFELQRVDEQHEAAGEHLVRIERNRERNVGHSTKRPCPRCDGVKLRRHRFNPKSKVEVDHCPNCGGYWLDAGELEQIRLEKKPAAAGKASQPAKLNAEVIRYVYRMQIEMRNLPRA